jgi:hypothetical protein
MDAVKVDGGILRRLSAFHLGVSMPDSPGTRRRSAPVLQAAGGM